MPAHCDAAAVLDREFFEIRAKVLELAACFDRLDRAEGDVTGDMRHQNLTKAVKAIIRPEGHRAVEVLRIFSRPYDENWRESFGL